MRRELADAQAAAAALAAEKAELVADKVRHNTLATCTACHAVLSTVRGEEDRVLQVLPGMAAERLPCCSYPAVSAATAVCFSRMAWHIARS